LDRWSVWAASFGGASKTTGNPITGSQDSSYQLYGLAVGADYKVSANTLFGFAVSGGGTSNSLANALGSAYGNLFQAGAYAHHDFGPAYLSAALAYGWHDVTTSRTVSLSGIDQLQAHVLAQALSARVEGGYRFTTSYLSVTPYAAAQAISLRLPNYLEQSLSGDGLFALSYQAQNVTDPSTELGVRFEKKLAVSDGFLNLRGRVAWAHDYNPNSSVTAGFEALPGATFVVNSARPDADSARLNAGIERTWCNDFSLAATVEGEASGNTNSYAARALAHYSW
jgi:uncharacterized protein with beta-barrel porin domain